ncbi:MAG: HAMP domain-containing protein, partial [Dehalococcoidia bacterium]
MNRLLYSIEFRLILGFAAVLALVLGSVSVYARTAATNEVERFESELSSVREERLERFVSGFVAARGDMRELQPVVDQAGSLYGLSIVIEDHEGTVITETQGLRDYSFFTDTPEVPTRDWLRVRRRFGGDVSFLPIGVSGEQVGSIAFTSAGRDSFVRPEPQATAVVDNINDFLLWAGIAGLIGGIGLTVVVSRRTLTPLRALRTGAEQLGAGDLTYRVPVSGQSELGRLGDTFNAMAEGLQSAEDQRRSLMADIAHELRTPLSNIQGYVEAMRDGLVKPDASTIETLHQQVTQLAHLMEDLRLLALADAGALRLDPRPESMAEVLRGSVEAVRPRADAKGVALETE